MSKCGYLISRWETEDGLPDSTATAMVQTPDGYLWLGTFGGLARFDGVGFKVFNRTTTPELPSVSIDNLHLDKNGRIWVSTDAGMACVDHGTWKTYGASEGWVGDFARMFAEDAAGNLYVSAFNGKIYQFLGERFVELPEPPGERKGRLALVEASGQLWVAQSRSFGRLIDRQWKGDDPAQMFPGETFLGAGMSRDGGFWLLTDRNLRKFREKRWVRTVEYSGPEFGFWSAVTESKRWRTLARPARGPEARIAHAKAQRRKEGKIMAGRIIGDTLGFEHMGRSIGFHDSAKDNSAMLGETTDAPHATPSLVSNPAPNSLRLCGFP